ncbi:hypothetical protein HYW58_00195 [Candidatus Kaiserbacteria bacterium]|nr:hypothetical protein [Candidatus Kaiserbacteria bacterium]
MAVPTNIKFKDYVKVVKLIAARKFDSFSYIKKRGSARRFDFIKNEKPLMQVVHEEKYIYSKDFKQTLEKLEVTEEEFRSYF